MEAYRKLCLKRQTELRSVLGHMEQYDQAIQLFFHQHAMLHSAKMAGTEPWSFEDEILDDITDEQFRSIPAKGEHSIAWAFWHIARIEDVCMNLLVAGSPQVLHQDDWLARMRVSVQETGNAMGPAGIAELSAHLDLQVLRAYRLVVGRRTCSIIADLSPQDLKRKVEPARLQRVLDEGAVLEPAHGLIDYWGRRDIAGLLLMPASRHLLVHLNEALQIERYLR